MKRLLIIAGMAALLSACGEGVKTMKDHVNKPGDLYCGYNATGASNPFRVCIYCKNPNSTTCGSLKKVRVHHGDNYDEFDLAQVPGSSNTCYTCTSDFYWEEE